MAVSPSEASPSARSPRACGTSSGMGWARKPARQFGMAAHERAGPVEHRVSRSNSRSRILQPRSPVVARRTGFPGSPSRPRADAAMFVSHACHVPSRAWVVCVANLFDTIPVSMDFPDIPPPGRQPTTRADAMIGKTWAGHRHRWSRPRPCRTSAQQPTAGEACPASASVETTQPRSPARDHRRRHRATWCQHLQHAGALRRQDADRARPGHQLAFWDDGRA